MLSHLLSRSLIFDVESLASNPKFISKMENQTSSPPKSRFDIKNLTKKQKIIIASVSSVVILIIITSIVVAATRCKNDPEIVKDAADEYKIDAVKKKISDGICVDSFGTGLVSFIKGYNLTNFE